MRHLTILSATLTVSIELITQRARGMARDDSEEETHRPTNDARFRFLSRNKCIAFSSFLIDERLQNYLVDG